MTTATICVLGLSTALLTKAEADLIARVEQAVLLDSQGKQIQRVVRDTAGDIERLQLSGMR